MPAEEAYQDEAIPTKRVDGIPISSSSQPAIMALMLEQLDVRPGMSVLEIGTGTGYNAALLAELAGTNGSVVSVDIDPDITAAAKAHLGTAGEERVRVECADGGFGFSAGSPYDRIIVTAAAADIPTAWWEQLKPGGRLVVPLVLAAGVQASVAFVNFGDRLESAGLAGCGFMPLRGAFAEVPGGVALDGGRRLMADGQPVDRERVLSWLQAEHQEKRLGLEMAPNELWSSFRPWLAFEEPGCCLLNEEAAATGSEARFEYSTGLLLEDGLALVALDGRTLLIRGFGPDAGSASKRLEEQIGRWEQAGRPGLETLQVRAYPPARAPRPRPGERLLRRPSTALAVSHRI